MEIDVFTILNSDNNILHKNGMIRTFHKTIKGGFKFYKSIKQAEKQMKVNQDFFNSERYDKDAGYYDRANLRLKIVKVKIIINDTEICH